MRKIFWGVVFILVNFNIGIGQISVDAMPDFIGYIFILMGMREDPLVNETLSKIKPDLIGMLAYTVFSYVLDRWMLQSLNEMMLGIISIVFLEEVIKFYIIYKIIQLIKDIQAYKKLYSNWKRMAICTVGIWIPVLLLKFSIGYVGILLIALLLLIVVVVDLVSLVCFIIHLNKATTCYMQRNAYNKV